MKKKIAIIGFGKWGKKVYNSIKNDYLIKFILNSKDKLSKIKSVDWVIITTPNNTHYRIVKYFLEKNFNVFCEKPLTTSSIKARKLIDYAKSNNIKLIISEIEKFKKIKLNIKKKNFIKRVHKSDNFNDFEYRIVYHDIYLLYKYLKNKNFKFNYYEKFNKKAFINLYCNRRKYEFNYSISKKKKIHLINNINFTSNKDHIKKMFAISLKYNATQIKRNNDRALFCIKFIEQYLK